MSTHLASCDGCGRSVPTHQIATLWAYGTEGEFCWPCRGYNPADYGEEADGNPLPEDA